MAETVYRFWNDRADSDDSACRYINKRDDKTPRRKTLADAPSIDLSDRDPGRHTFLPDPEIRFHVSDNFWLDLAGAVGVSILRKVWRSAQETRGRLGI